MTGRRHTFSRRKRIRSSDDFSATFDARVRESRGPVTMWLRPNDLPHCRLGISMSRKVGIAARRNRIKRMLRESFRLLQHDLPVGYDLVITVRPHEPLLLAEYQKILSALSVRLHGKWQRSRPGAET